MDQIQTWTEEEIAAEAEDEVSSTTDVEAEVEDAETSAEMGELPVEDWDYQRPKRGQVRKGVILDIREQEIVVDVGDKRDGIVPYADMQRLGDEEIAELSRGDEVLVFIMRPEDQDGNLLVSLHLAKQERAWHRAKELFENGEIWEGQVVGYNKGGLVVPVEDIRGFVPASQVPGFPSGLGQEERLARLSALVGETVHVKVIEINRRKRRLILSATRAQREWRKEQRERLLEDLREGEVRKGRVTSLCSFGAFVDLGGADGLIHLSELSWRRIRHPREVVNVGDEIEVYVLRLDHDRGRIGLSLKRLQPEPWSLIEEKYELGQLVEGVVTNVVDFGAFAELEEGVEGLIHVSELADGQVSHPKEVVKKGDLLLLRIIRIDTRRKRLGLSLKRVLEAEWAEWAAHLAEAQKGPAVEEAGDSSPPEEAEPQVAEAAEPAAMAESQPVPADDVEKVEEGMLAPPVVQEAETEAEEQEPLAPAAASVPDSGESADTGEPASAQAMEAEHVAATPEVEALVAENADEPDAMEEQPDTGTEDAPMQVGGAGAETDPAVEEA